MTETTLIKEMLEHAVHFGHRTTKWDPRMKSYIYGEKDGIHIIDVTKTARKLEKAMEYLAKSASEGARILFVGTKPQSTEIVRATAIACNAHFVVKKWVPGFLTNFSTLKVRIKRLRDLKAEKGETDFAQYTKKERSKILKEIEKLEDAFGGVENLKDLPNVVIVGDVARDTIAVLECHKLGIPVVGIVDTNANPDVVTYPIPGNDDAMKSIKFFFNKFKEAITGTK